jgi:hypothetical protein
MNNTLNKTTFIRFGAVVIMIAWNAAKLKKMRTMAITVTMRTMTISRGKMVLSKFLAFLERVGLP